MKLMVIQEEDGMMVQEEDEEEEAVDREGGSRRWSKKKKKTKKKLMMIQEGDEDEDEDEDELDVDGSRRLGGGGLYTECEGMESLNLQLQRGDVMSSFLKKQRGILPHAMASRNNLP